MTSPSATSGADKSNLSPVLAANAEKEPKVDDTRDPLALIGGKDSEDCLEGEEDGAVSSEGEDEQLAETNTKTSSLQLEEMPLKSKIQSDRDRLLHENDMLLRELHRTRETLHNQQYQHQEDRRLLHSRGKELESTRTFLDKSDVYSLADVKSMVESLNSEIHQLAAYSADTLLEHDMDVITDEVRNHAMRQSQQYLDDRILALLIQREGHAGVLQIAFQAALLFECTNFLKLWALEPADHKILGELHARVQEFSELLVYHAFSMHIIDGHRYRCGSWKMESVNYHNEQISLISEDGAVPIISPRKSA